MKATDPGYYKFQVVHFDPFLVEPFLADSRIMIKLKILIKYSSKLLPAGYQGLAWAMERHWDSLAKEFQSLHLVSPVMVEMEGPVLENTEKQVKIVNSLK